ncbi:MAG: hypothetical protein JRI68_05915 [Deltaproteobacteria bacterium]|nr:hypothetical protein [Deltaproteobacteria bacterium]
MGFALVFTMVALGVAVVVSQHLAAKRKQRQQEALPEGVSEFMGDAEIDPETAAVSGTIDGFAATFRLTSRGAGSNSESWSECDVVVATDLLDIELRPQTRREERTVEEGLARDVLVQEKTFDDHFIVEAAPPDAARQALGESVRECLLDLHPCEVTATDEGIRLAKKGWIEEPEAIRAFIDTAVLLATAIQETTGQLRDARRKETALAGYRGGSADGERELVEQARAETADLRALRGKRKEAEKAERTMIIVGLVALVVLLMAVQMC